MNYAFLLVLAAFLLITTPFLLIGAYREGNRRREVRGMPSMRDDMPAHRSDAAARRPPPPPKALASGSSPVVPTEVTLDVYRESSWRERGMLLEVYHQREDLPTNKVAEPESPHLSLSEILYRAAEHSRAASKA